MDSTAVAGTEPRYSELGTSSHTFWAASAEERERTFALLREHDAVSWQPPIEGSSQPGEHSPGYWAVVRHADIVQVSRDPDTFISSKGVLFDDIPEQYQEMMLSFLGMDAPRHDALRTIISAAFTPKHVERISGDIESVAREVVDSFAAEPGGRIEFVHRCANPLPLRMFSAMFGLPAEFEERTAWAALGVVATDPEVLVGRAVREVQVEALRELHAIAREVVARRRERPENDLFTSLAHARVDGQVLSDDEIGAFFAMLAVAGLDTTSQTLTLALRALTDAPEQRAWLREDFAGRIDTALEEIVRHTSAVMTFRRTASVDTRLGGRHIRAGDKVVLFYSSGNRDPEVFDEPARLDLARQPNPHVGFGGGGRHFCLGSRLAKSMLRALLRELLTRVPDIHTIGEPELAEANFIRAVSRQEAGFTPEGSPRSGVLRSP